MPIKHYLRPPAITAGFAVLLIGYRSAAVIVFQTAGPHPCKSAQG